MADHKTIVLGFPEFPEKLRKYLPKGYTMLNVDKKCVCHKCAPRLWAYRFGKSDRDKRHEDQEKVCEQSLEKSASSSSKSLKRKRLPEKESKISRPKVTETSSELNQIRRSCDYRVPVALFEAHLNQLCRGSTYRQAEFLTSFDEALKQFHRAREAQDIKLLPKPRLLCEPLAEVFFDGCLASIGYSWSDQSSNSATRMSKYNTGATISNRIGLPKIIKLNSATFLDRDLMEDYEIVSTIFHELVHAFLGLYVCQGSPCLSNRLGSRKIALCRYMSARSIHLFHTATIRNNEDMEVVGTDHYCGHGPVFQHLVRRIHDHAAQVIGCDLLPQNSRMVLKDLKRSEEDEGEEDEGEEDEEEEDEGEEDQEEDEEAEEAEEAL